MEQAPKEITVCRLECVVMPNGEVIVLGNTVGWFKDVGPYLSLADTDTRKMEAAAPSLLAACEAVEGHFTGDGTPTYEEIGKLVKQVEAAIAKATN